MAMSDGKYRPIRAVIAAQAARIPDKTYVHSIEQDQSLTYGDLFRLGNRMAGYFRDRGIKANDRVLLLSENSLEFMAMGILFTELVKVLVSEVTLLILPES